MKQKIAAILSRYGQTVYFPNSDGQENPVETRAFLQPLSSKEELTPDSITQLGVIDGRLWRYLGGSDVPIAPGMTLLQNNQQFLVRSSRDYYVGNTLLYRWAVLEQIGENT